MMTATTALIVKSLMIVASAWIGERGTKWFGVAIKALNVGVKVKNFVSRLNESNAESTNRKIDATEELTDDQRKKMIQHHQDVLDHKA